MRAEEIREMSEDDIRARIDELERERFNLRFRGATEPLEDPLRLRSIRHDIARLHTVLREKALAGGAPRRGRKNRRAAGTSAQTATTAKPSAR
jgi:large subunit ribosomal protein L29